MNRVSDAAWLRGSVRSLSRQVDVVREGRLGGLLKHYRGPADAGARSPILEVRLSDPGGHSSRALRLPFSRIRSPSSVVSLPTSSTRDLQRVHSVGPQTVRQMIVDMVLGQGGSSARSSIRWRCRWLGAFARTAAERESRPPQD